MNKNNFKDILNHLKINGFFFEGSQIYSGIKNTWDYGPIGFLLKENIRKRWIRKFIDNIENNYLIDANSLLNPKVWMASGHLNNFKDLMTDCKKCKLRYKIEDLISDVNNLKIIEDMISKNKVSCPKCKSKEFTLPKDFDLMLKTQIGSFEDTRSNIYLRPELAQGIFINFWNCYRHMRLTLPFGIGQIGKSYRNEITPSNFIFRTREFEQMELEIFTESENNEKIFNFYLLNIKEFLNEIGINPNNLKEKSHSKSELAHYSKKTIDINYNFPFGWKELWGLADRGNYDLTQHMNESKKDIRYIDHKTHKKTIPYVIEPSVGIDRLVLALLCDTFKTEIVNGKNRSYFSFKPNIAPFFCAVQPLSSQLVSESRNVYEILKEKFKTTFDSTGGVGKRYRRQDAIGTPFCIVFDFESKNDQCVTIRERDSMKQKRIKIKDMINYLEKFKEND